jgi:ferrochelatase
VKKGVLLINLGTPDSVAVSDVRSYLNEFLLDPRVIDLPSVLRWILVKCIILPFRPKKSAHAYEKIWTQQGSPLLVNSNAISKKLQTKLNHEYTCALAMRYGKPSIEQALKTLKGCSEIIVIPLFPQYSSAATGSAIEKALLQFANLNTIPHLKVVRDFYQHELFINALCKKIQHTPAEHYLFSYHGLPERQILKAGCQAVCEGYCSEITQKNHFCYRAQCSATTRMIAQKLGLEEHQFSQSFQSRLGKTPWIKPYTDETLNELASRGIKELAIICPSFVADCLETLEEIGIQAQEQWQAASGNKLKLIPCLNDDDEFITMLEDIVVST